MKKIVRKMLFGCILSFFMLGILKMPTNATGVNVMPIAMDDMWISSDIGVEGEVDFYSVTLPKAGWLTVSYQGFSIYDSYIQVLNNDLTKSYAKYEVYYSSNISPVTKTFTLALEPGTYNFKIWAYGKRTGDYRLKASFAPANNNEIVDNNEFMTAMNLSEKQLVTGFLSADDRVDFYQITLPKAKTLNVYMTSYMYDAYIQVWNSDFVKIFDKEVYYASETAPKTYVYEKFLEAGTYYVKITPYGSNTGRYTLKWETKQYVQEIKLNKSKLVLDNGKSYQLSASVLPKDANNKKVQWTSSNKDVVTVSSKGKIKAKRAGSATITVTSTDGSNVSKSCFVVVKPGKAKITKLKRYSYDARRLDIQVNGVKGASGYQYMWSKQKNFQKSKKSYSTQYTGIYTGRLAKNTKYYVKVRAYYSDGTKKYYGPWSNIRSIVTKK